MLGAREADSEITCQVIFTGEWSLAVKEAEAINALVDQGADVITCHVDGPKVVIETAVGCGAFVCGYHADQSPLVPEKYLTGAWNRADGDDDDEPAAAAGRAPGTESSMLKIKGSVQRQEIHALIRSAVGPYAMSLVRATRPPAA